MDWLAFADIAEWHRAMQPDGTSTYVSTIKTFSPTWLLGNMHFNSVIDYDYMRGDYFG